MMISDSGLLLGRAPCRISQGAMHCTVYETPPRSKGQSHKVTRRGI